MTSENILDLSLFNSVEPYKIDEVLSEIEVRLKKILQYVFSVSDIELKYKAVRTRKKIYKLFLCFDIKVLLAENAIIRSPSRHILTWEKDRRLDTRLEQESFINQTVDQLARVIFFKELGLVQYMEYLKVINHLYVVQKDPILRQKHNLQLDGKLLFHGLKKVVYRSDVEPFITGYISNTNLVYSNKKLPPKGDLLRFTCTLNTMNLSVTPASPEALEELFYWNHPQSIKERILSKMGDLYNNLERQDKKYKFEARHLMA